jgi:hypothetical protein
VLTCAHNTPFGDTVDAEDDVQPLVLSMFADASRAVRLFTGLVAVSEVDKERLRRGASTNINGFKPGMAKEKAASAPELSETHSPGRCCAQYERALNHTSGRRSPASAKLRPRHGARPRRSSPRRERPALE